MFPDEMLHAGTRNLGILRAQLDASNVIPPGVQRAYPGAAREALAVRVPLSG
jgi:hypothetical protein